MIDEVLNGLGKSIMGLITCIALSGGSVLITWMIEEVLNGLGKSIMGLTYKLYRS